MRGPILAQPDAVMRQHMDGPGAHQRGQTQRGPQVIGEDQKSAGIGDDAAMQRHAVHRGCHAMLAHAPMDIAPGIIARTHGRNALHIGVVRAGEVGRTADHLGHRGHQRGQRLLAGDAGADLGFALGDGGAVRIQGIRPALGQAAGHRALEFGLLRMAGEAFEPGTAGAAAPAAGFFPGGFDVLGDVEGRVAPAHGRARAGDFLGPQGRAMAACRAGLFGCCETDDGAAGDQRRLTASQRKAHGTQQRRGAVAIHPLHRPATGLEALQHVLGEGQFGAAINGNAVIIPQHAQLIEAVMAGQRGGLVRNPLLQVTIGGDDPGAVIDQRFAEARRQMPLGQGHAHGGGNALAQRARGHFNGRMLATLGVAGGNAVQLAEIADVVHRQAGMPRQMEQGIKQHGAMPGREHETVTIGPGGVGRVVFQHARPQSSRGIGHAHWHARMAGIGLLHRIHGQDPDGIGHPSFLGHRQREQRGLGGQGGVGIGDGCGAGQNGFSLGLVISVAAGGAGGNAEGSEPPCRLVPTDDLRRHGALT